jgi:hypothetical protein
MTWAGGSGAGGALGEVEVEPHLFGLGAVLHAPAGGQRGAQQQAAAALVVGVGLAVDVVEREFALGVVVGDLDPYAGVVAKTLDIRGGSGMNHRIGDEFTGEDDGVVHDIGEAPALEGVADKRARGGHRPPDRLEGSRCPRRVHWSPHGCLDVPRILCPSAPRSMRRPRTECCTTARPG